MLKERLYPSAMEAKGLTSSGPSGRGSSLGLGAVSTPLVETWGVGGLDHLCSGIIGDPTPHRGCRGHAISQFGMNKV